jgi:alpha-1,2-mannosyltransferase
MTASERPPLVARAATLLPFVAVLVFGLATAAVLAVAGSTLGFDFRFYYDAARRALEGGSLYFLDGAASGEFSRFQYPPTFLPLILPFGLLDVVPATWAWLALMAAALLAGIWLLPVSVRIRWLTLLLAGLSWPVAYTLKLGQVTPILFLLAVLGWRALNDQRPRAAGILGATAGLGAAIKVQPGLLLLWALLSGRWRAALSGAAVIAGLATLGTILAGPATWGDYLKVFNQNLDQIIVPNVTPGGVAQSLGLSAEAAAAVQNIVIVGALAAVLLSIRACSPTASYLVAVAGSQLVSPALRDHTAMILLIPVAWLLARGQAWAVIIPLVTALPLVGLTPPAAYPLAFIATIAATFALGARIRRTSDAVATLPAAA